MLLIMTGFAVAFGVKLRVVPFHGWLPDAYAQSPTAATIVLSALMAKTGAYGLLRFVVPLFPQASQVAALCAVSAGVITILYGAVVAMGQRDIKRFIAYTSISHMGYLVIGIFVWNEVSLHGAVIQMISHAVTTSALFIIAALLVARTGTSDLQSMGGFWKSAPRMGGVALVFALASMGLPGLGNFMGEFLILYGSLQFNAVLAACAACGAIASAVYALWMMQRVFQGPLASPLCTDLTRREMPVLLALVALILWIGLHPTPVINAASPALDALRQTAGSRAAYSSTFLSRHLPAGIDR